MHPFASIETPHGPPALDLLGGPAERYGLIYADPPWKYENYSELGEDRNASAWYDCMSIEDLKALPVGDIAAEDCMLAMWATFPLLPEALMLVSHYGFRYVTIGHVWVKLNKKVGIREIVNLAKDIFMSTGYWTRSNAEILILASKGSPKRGSKSVRQVVFAPRAQHSQKPLVFRENLEKLILTNRRVELFCRRQPTEKWHAWGNQVGAIEAETITKRRRVIEIAPAPLLEMAA